MKNDLIKCGLRVFPCWSRNGKKGPLTNKGESWLEVSKNPQSETVKWAEADLIGVVVPDDIVIVDVDTYKGITPELIDEKIGSTSPWAASHIQNTINGGAHFAFRAPEWPVRQGSNLGLNGLDTRTAGKGFICTGDGYPQIGMGISRLAYPETLPVLPDHFRDIFELHAPREPAPVPEQHSQDATILSEALRFIDPTERDVWRNVGISLKAHKLEGMFELWDYWSQGGFWHGDPPLSYDPESQQFQWDSFKVDRTGSKIGTGTVYYLALQGGWVMPKGFDTSSAFTTDPSQPPTYNKNDTENAFLFLNEHYPDQTLICSDEEFYFFDSKVWRPLAKDNLKMQMTCAMAKTRPSAATIMGAYNVARFLLPQMPGVFQSKDSEDVVFMNGVLDIRSRQMSPHRQTVYTTTKLPFEFDVNATCPNWITFLNQIFNNDFESINLLQEWIGYLLTPSTKHQKMMILLGPPRCGKGTICRVIEDLIGKEAYSGGTLAALAKDSFVDSLRRKSVVVIGDAEKRLAPGISDFVAARLKMITGEDSLPIERKYLSTITTRLKTRFMVASNTIPRIFDDSGGLSSRMLLLPFYVSFEGREDRTLESRLRTELPGIAAWAVEGWHRLEESGVFTTPLTAGDEIEFMRDSFSPLSEFIQTRCTFAEENRITSADLYAAYRASAIDDKPLSRRVFTGAFKDATRGRNVRYGGLRTGTTTTKGFYGVDVNPR